MDKYNEATDRASIDYHYFVRGRLPEWESYIEQFSSQSADVRQKLSYHADIFYGEHDRDADDAKAIYPQSYLLNVAHDTFRSLLARDRLMFHL